MIPFVHTADTRKILPEILFEKHNISEVYFTVFTGTQGMSSHFDNNHWNVLMLRINNNTSSICTPSNHNDK